MPDIVDWPLCELALSRWQDVFDVPGGRKELHVTLVDSGNWPSDDDILKLLSQGVYKVRVLPPVQLSVQSAASALNFVRFLRDARSWDLVVEWTLRSSEIDVKMLRHLAAPTNVEEFDEGWVTVYRREIPFYWRNGPGFVQTKDFRDQGAGNRITIDEPEFIETFKAALSPVQASLLDAESLQALQSEGILVVLGAVALTLPCRIRRWSIEANS